MPALGAREMNWDAIGAIGTFISAIAVVISLIYLAIQTKQNTKTMKAASFHQVRMSFSEIPLAIAQDSELVTILARINSDPDSLSREEVIRYEMLLLTIIRRAESAYFQSIEGSLPLESWRGISETCKAALSDSIALHWWSKTNHRFETSFRDEIDTIIQPPDPIDTAPAKSEHSASVRATDT